MKILKFFHAMDFAELSRFRKFLESPYFVDTSNRNKNGDFFQYLLSVLKRYAKDPDGFRITEAELRRLYPNEPLVSYSDLLGRTKRRNTKLTKHLLEFWKMEAFRQASTAENRFSGDLLLLRSLKAHKLYEEHDKLYGQIRERHESVRQKDWNYFLNEVDLLIEEYNRYASTPFGYANKISVILRKQIDNVENARIIRQLWLACLVWNQNQVVVNDLVLPNVSEIVNKIQENPDAFKDNVLLYLLYDVFRFQNGIDEDKAFAEFETILEENRLHLPDYYLSFTTFAIAFCRKKIFQGFEEYRQVVRKYLSYQMEYSENISPALFKNHIKNLAKIAKNREDHLYLHEQYRKYQGRLQFKDLTEEKHFFKLVNGFMALHREDYYSVVRELHDCFRKTGNHVYWNLEARALLIIAILNEEFSLDRTAMQKADEDFGKDSESGKDGFSYENERKFFMKQMKKKNLPISEAAVLVFLNFLKNLDEYTEAISGENVDTVKLQQIEAEIESSQIEVILRSWLKALLQKAKEQFR